MNYGQFCPIAKSLELIGDRWTMLVLREVLMGGRRFNEIERGLGGISTALLSKRLKSLCECNLLTKRKHSVGGGQKYYPTQSAHELQPVLMALGDWGMKWTRNNLTNDDYDVELLMLYLERSIAFDQLPMSDFIVRFEFPNLVEQPKWWLIISGNHVEICTKDPEFDVNIYMKSDLNVMTNIWLGHDTYQRALDDGDLMMHGESVLTQNISQWMRCSEFDAERRLVP